MKMDPEQRQTLRTQLSFNLYLDFMKALIVGVLVSLCFIAYSAVTGVWWLAANTEFVAEAVPWMEVGLFVGCFFAITSLFSTLFKAVDE